jgi:hypothetical protein
VTYSFPDLTITTWRRSGNAWIWRARRNADDVVEFEANRDANDDFLYKAALAAFDRENARSVANQSPTIDKLA